MTDPDEHPPRGEFPERRTDSDSLGWPARLGTGLVEFYQHNISPMLPPSCRFQPSCSEYTRRAIERYGLVRGSWLGLKRILKCHPLHPGGHDPVP